jgi:predicted metalloprotease with PDZ domain
MSHFDNIFYRLFIDHERLRAILIFSFALCILAISLTFFALSMGKPYMGTSLSMDDQGWTVERVDPNGLASQAGIRKGDRPIEING